MSSNIAISVNNISKRFEMYSKPRDRLLQLIFRGRRQYFKEFWALHDVSFEVAKGETVGILGRNGSGKSTLLQIIAGTLNPTQGEVKANGVLAALLELGSGFNPEFTGRENVYLNGTILGFSREEMDAKFQDIVDFADIGDHLDQPVKTYSSGMYVRLAFAVQACVEPQILIVDEALSVGDEKFQRKCFDHIEKLRKGGCSILLVTHSTATVEKFCQRGVLLHKGRVHGIGSSKEIVDQYHALLYSDERAYLRYLSAKDEENQAVSAERECLTKPVCDEVSNEDRQGSNDGLKAVIRRWGIVDKHGEGVGAFRTGDQAQLYFDVDVLAFVGEIQAGILLRTVEGVSAFGTSTLYHKNNFLNATAGKRLRFSFSLDLNLFPGTYFATLAIAEAISHADMSYLDKKTDAMVIKIDQIRPTGSGIAALTSEVSVSELG
ncbi:ABC transporter ATP-binding protein [Jeongeupia wiesaeckerbachi]|uniref:ABC transporter ATP-binding protein n=1 Tax=Jeongeupia wiesaeckerbachi TaxID=3051218 RepID=UPI003D80055C